ncbi:hypothetical protein TWF730_010906 [Orbilia blumenaviensis]|uniref:Secreted protein n=1 Tax=Orbilia blumenaviensis TaxID=1796055 RepID=A0AAV9UME0_9PEZI
MYRQLQYYLHGCGWWLVCSGEVGGAGAVAGVMDNTLFSTPNRTFSNAAGRPKVGCRRLETSHLSQNFFSAQQQLWPEHRAWEK